MTSTNIPPCPVCGKQLTPSTYNGIPCLVGTESCSGCGGYHSLIPEVSKHSFDGILGRACRELDIETVDQLKSRLAPDPRVAVLDDVLLFTENAIRYAHLAYCRTLEREPEYLAEMKRIIAAQRGEGV